MVQTVKKLIENLNALSNNWKDNAENLHQLDANWVCVKFYKKDWRLARECGAKKDCYWGWILWSSSVNENGSNFAVEVEKLVFRSELPLMVRERQL